MTAQSDDEAPRSAIAPDPLASLRASTRAIADLAFGDSLETLTPHDAGGRHLALLTAEALQLDLDDPAQRQFGDYELLEQIGEGGMGVVYRAHQRSLDRDVALKLLAAGPWASREFVERFRREAQHAARMQHPNIVAIHEVGSAEELHFFSMRLVRGGSLAALLKNEGKVAPLRAAQMLRAIAEAVDYAHRLGVLHLDLKPANVLLDENGAPHVADFGLARQLDGALADGDDEISGTPSYMSPEQASPQTARITPATDIWGLGAILYELVTGQPPFLGKSPHETLRLVVEGSLLSPRRLVSNLPRDLEAIILKCLARDTAERYATARALADDLGRFIEGRAVRARPLGAPQRVLRWARREPRLALSAAAGTTALLAGIAATTQQWQRAEGNARSAVVNASLANERLWQARIDQAAIAVGEGHSYDALSGLAANITEREAQGLPTHDDRIRIAAVERSAPRLIDAIAMGSNIYGVAFSPDGASIAVALEDNTLRLIDAATGSERWRTSFKAATHFWDNGPDALIRLEELRFSPDGRRLVGHAHISVDVLVAPPGFDEILFDVLDGKVLVPPPSIFPDFRDATYSPDGAYAIVRSADQRAVLVRTADWRPLGTVQSFDKVNPPWLLTAQARFALTSVGTDIIIHDPRTLGVLHVLKSRPNGRVTAWVSGPDGNSVILGHLDGRVERVDCASGRSEALTPSPIGRIGRITFSRDGRWFSAVADSGEILAWDNTLRATGPLMLLNATPESHRDHVVVDASARTVMASIDYQMGLWYLPDAVSAPVRLMGESPNASAWWNRAFDYDAALGLVASDGGQGELRLWRVQQLAPRGVNGSPLPADPLRVANGHILSVDGSNVRLLNAADGRALSPRIELPSAIGFADLTADGNHLVVSAANRLFVYDAAKWTLSQKPIELPDDPARVFIDPTSAQALVLFSDYADGVNRELGQVWDLADTTHVSAAVPFPARTRFSFSANGDSVLAWTWDYKTLQLFDAKTLQPRWPLISLTARLAKLGSGDEATAVTESYIADAQFSAAGDIIDVLTAGDASPQWETSRLSSRLWQFDAATGKELRQTLLSETGGAATLAFMPDRHRAIVQRPDSRPLWWEEAHGVTELPAGSANELGALTLAAGASMFARAASMNAVTLTSTSTLQWLTPLLPTSVPTPGLFLEHPIQIAVTLDGNGLVGRTRNGHWLYWDVSPDSRPAQRIAREAALLNPDQKLTKAALSSPLAEDDRQALRAADPGPPVWVGGFEPARIPPRQTDLPARLFDLSPNYNESLHLLHRTQFSSFREFAPGVHRFHGVDFDARGILALSMKGFAPEVDPERPPPREMRGIHPGIERFAALDLLLTGFSALNTTEKNRPFAMIEFDYQDGSRERRPILEGRSILPTWLETNGKPGGTTVPVAWRATNTGTPAGYQKDSKIYITRIANPHPERAVATLAFEAVDEAWSSPLIFAITAEASDAGLSGSQMPAAWK
jgi:hypothetical protein